MSEILSYFFSPEESVSKLLIERDKDKWKQGLLGWLLIAILLGFSTMAAYRLNGISIADILGTDFEQLVQSTFGMQVSEGTIWLSSAVILIIQTLVIVGIKFVIWGVTLYVVNLILKERLKFYDIILLSMFAMLTWLTAQIFTVIAVVIASICPIDIIKQMVLGISMILEYWYLIILAIGVTIGMRSTFLKGGLIVLGIQGICWGLSSIIPGLQIILA